jgi:hypothetical protein
LAWRSSKWHRSSAWRFKVAVTRSVSGTRDDINTTLTLALQGVADPCRPPLDGRIRAVNKTCSHRATLKRRARLFALVITAFYYSGVRSSASNNTTDIEHHNSKPAVFDAR